MRRKKLVAFGILGTTLDSGTRPARWERWRPTVSLCQQPDLRIDRFELIYTERWTELAQIVMADIAAASPQTEVGGIEIKMDDAWDFERVFAALHDVARSYRFDVEKEEYLVHITTGSHVAQICLFLLTEARYFPARLVQTGPPKRGAPPFGTHALIDLDLSRYDRLRSRFGKERREALGVLKAGIDTRNAAFNRLIERLEQVAAASRAPILLLGPTGAGKTQLARRIYELKKQRRQVSGELAEINCATLRGDAAMSALFGHVKGAFTGAQSDRAGLLRRAHQGVVFLDEIGELGLDEQAMLLRALEEKSFYPMGSDKEVQSDFQLIAGTNRDLGVRVAEGRFREDLLARLDLWTFHLPGLRERPEDLEPNLDFELERAEAAIGLHVTISREARERYLRFATAPDAAWSANFRDLNASVLRMATLAAGGRITGDEVDEEIDRLRQAWNRAGAAARPSASGGDGTGAARLSAGRGHAAGADEGADGDDPLAALLGADRAAALDRFDRVQLADVLAVCRRARSLSDAGRALFAASRRRKTSANDADRLRKYLARFELAWSDVATDR